MTTEVDDGSSLKHLGILMHDSLKHMGWRLRSHARLRIAIDIAALCTALRVVVMVDYAGKVPRLPDQLSILLNHLSKEFRSVTSLRVMSMDDTAYLIHHNNLILYMNETLNRVIPLKFVVLDAHAARFASPAEEEGALRHFTCFKSHFLSVFSKDASTPMECCMHGEADVVKDRLLNAVHDACFATGHHRTSSGSLCQASQEMGFEKAPLKIWLIELGSFLNVCEVALPTLNGWLLGYPAIYLVQKESICRAVRVLSFSSLHLYQLMIQSEVLTFSATQAGSKVKPAMHELTSFTVPNELSLQGTREEWVEIFMTMMRSKMKDSKLWKHLELQLTLQICQSVAL